MGEFDDQPSLEELYKNFIETPANLRSQTFDDDDLLGVYDYAGDIADTDTQREILWIASQLYPDDEDFLIRRAYYLLDGSFTEEIKYISSRLPEDSLHRFIILIRLNDDDSPDAWDSLCKGLLKAKRRSLDDELIIRIFEVIKTESQLDWLLDNQKNLEERCLYRDTFLYELAICTSDFRRPQKALPIAKKLTVIDPFESKFWYLQASIEGYGLSDISSAESDASYALALAPDLDMAKLLLAYLTLLEGKDYERGFNLVDEILKTDDGNPDAVILGILIASACGDDTRKKRYLSAMKVSRLDKTTQIAFEILFGGEVKDIEHIRLSDIYLLYSDRLPYEVSSEALTKTDEKNDAIVAAFLILYDRNIPDGNFAMKSRIAEYLDKAGRPHDVLTLACDYLDIKTLLEVNGLILMYFYAKAGIATGYKDEVKPDLDTMIELADEKANSSDFLEKIQGIGILHMLKKLRTDTYGE